MSSYQEQLHTLVSQVLLISETHPSDLVAVADQHKERGRENGNKGRDEGGRTKKGAKRMETEGAMREAGHKEGRGRETERRNTHTKEEGNRERRSTKGEGGHKGRELNERETKREEEHKGVGGTQRKGES